VLFFGSLLLASCGSNHMAERELVEVTLTPARPSIPAGTTVQLTASGRYSDDTTEDLTAQVGWTSSTTAVATIHDGVATGLAAGSTAISATRAGMAATITLTVTDATLVSIEVTPADASIAMGTTLQYSATGVFTDHSTRDLTEQVAWTSSVTAIATMSNAAGSRGVAHAEQVGASEIRATDATTGVYGKATLTATDAVLVAIEVTPPNAEIAKGTSQQFTATGVYSDSSTQDLTAQVVWGSSSTDVAMISNASPAQGLASTSLDTVPGSTTITATSGAISGSIGLTVTAAVLVSIEVAPNAPVMPDGTSLPFTATGTYSDGRVQDLTLLVTWAAAAGATVSNDADSKGLVTAHAATGTASITATDDATGISGAATVTFDAAVLTSITVQPNPVSMAKGTTVQFAAECRFSDGQILPMTNVTWSSSSADLAISNAPDSRGLAEALANIGTATVRATDPASGLFGEATVTLTAAVLVSIAVDPANQTVPRSSIEDYVATGIYSDFTTQDLTDIVTWSSSNTNVATISNASGSQGTVMTLIPGVTTIRAIDPATGIVGEATLTVNNTTLASITITPTNPTLAKGARLQFVAIGHYQDGSTRNLTQFVSWSSSAPNIAGVSNAAKRRGVATGKNAGTATITATDSATLISGTTAITVSTATLQSITVTPRDSTIPNKTRQYFTATGTFSDGSSSDLTAVVSWSSSNEAIATISNQTFNQGIATGVSPGTVTITAFESTRGLSATATLTVSSATLVAIALAPDAPSVIRGTTLPMIATGRFSDGSTKDLTREVTWTSRDTAIATVLNVGSTKGTVTGVAVGTTSIAATYPQTVVSGTTALTVVP
jgi:uncharacterized protein YjdB